MEPESSHGLQQLPTEARLPREGELPPGEKKKHLAPASRKDPRFEELQQVLMEWINATLLPEHIVVRSLEEDLFDGLILHHLFQKLAALRLEMEEMALTCASQQRKLAVVLDAVNRSLQPSSARTCWPPCTSSWPWPSASSQTCPSQPTSMWRSSPSRAPRRV